MADVASTYSLGDLLAGTVLSRQSGGGRVTIQMLDGTVVDYDVTAGRIYEQGAGGKPSKTVISSSDRDQLRQHFSPAPVSNTGGPNIHPARPDDGAGDPSSPPTTPAQDFAAQARLLFPWLTSDLLGVFTDAWAEHGDPTIALQEVRYGTGKSLYDQIFPGNRRPDGTLRYSEEQFWSVQIGYRNALRDAGLNPDIFESRLVDLMEGEVSVQEFAGRVSAITQGIMLQSDQIRQAFGQAYGHGGLTDEALIAIALDPENIGLDILEHRIGVAQVAGAAMEFGFDRGIGRAEDIVRRTGLGLQGAREFYGQATGLSRTLGGIASRYDPSDTTVDVGELEQGLLLQDQQQIDRFARILSRERASFSTQRGQVQSNQFGALTGLSA
jgi:hypothetical protein